LCRLAAKALSQIGAPALTTLIAHLQHSDPFVRGESALAIGWMGPLARSAVPFLTSIVHGPRPSLARTPASDFAPPIRGKVDPDDLEPQETESPTPTQHPSPTSDPGTPEENCRVYAAQALGRIGPSAASALRELQEAGRSGPDSLRRAAQQAIRQIQGT
jgi:HEAT repeat protein